jgi:hypothetical protein
MPLDSCWKKSFGNYVVDWASVIRIIAGAWQFRLENERWTLNFFYSCWTLNLFGFAVNNVVVQLFLRKELWKFVMTKHLTNRDICLGRLVLTLPDYPSFDDAFEL